jgi:hypothetical protein
MAHEIAEADWKLLRELKPRALERFCERALAEVSRIVADTSRGTHDRYLQLFRVLDRSDRALSEAFNDLRRSTALMRISMMRSHGLLTDEEFARFSAPTRETVRRLLEAAGTSQA